MDALFEILATPETLVGTLAGLGVAIGFHWLAPEGVDTVAAGAWFVATGAGLGLGWAVIRKRRARK